MIVTYQYRINPTPDQVSLIDNWFALWLRHWNYAWGQRLNWLHRTRCQIDGCSALSEPIAQIPSRVNYYTQQTALKEKNPENKNIYSEVQQINLQRLDKTSWRWLTPDQTGKRAGRPRFKKKGELRSFGFALLQSPKSCLFFISF